MQTTGTHINYLQICHRKLWLFAHGIQMEHTSDTVYEGKMLHENAYPQRSAKYEELEIGPIKIDYFDAKEKVVHEIKLSNKVEHAHEWQLKYYLYVLEQAGISASGVLEYPKLRKKEEYWLSEPDRKALAGMINTIDRICAQEKPPLLHEKSICKRCSYFDFCFSGE